MRLFSDKNRPVHMGSYPLETLLRRAKPVEWTGATAALDFRKLDTPHSIVNAMGEYQAMMDVLRDGFVNPVRGDIPDDLQERSNHLKSFGYFHDASMVGVCKMPQGAVLNTPLRNPDIDRLANDLRTRQTKTLATGIDMIMADLRESIDAPPRSMETHTSAIVFLYEHNRAPRETENGSEWIMDAQDHRACLRSTETAIIVANYLRLLGFEGRAHTATTTEVDLSALAISAGLVVPHDGQLIAPHIGPGWGVAVVTTDCDLAVDLPLCAMPEQPWFKTRGPSWWLGKGHAKSAFNRDPYAKRDYVLGAHPFERLKRVEKPTTYIDEPNVARVPKRTDMFARAQFGDMGKKLQEGAKGGKYVRKAAPSFAQRRALGAFLLIQNGATNPNGARPTEAQRNADNIKAAGYFLGADAVGLSHCPEWAWYSHDAGGAPINPTHDNAISMIIDQGYETMEGSSGDDWIAVAQSMRAYLRFSLLGGVIAQHIRNLGYSAKAHTVMDGEVLQPPLLLLSGLGEVSRIGEVILNPYLGPRLKSGVVTTDMPMAHDKPIDFGLQKFCDSCNKCARECPSGAITAGPKLMFNGYEIWKSDSQKCATYRITTEGGAMCGRCMKTCPWNLEGLFAEAPFRWAASNIPAAAPMLAKLDDMVGNGGLNDIKKWWWDLEIQDDGGYHQTTHVTNRRDLQKGLDLKFEDQTLAVYPANLAPPPWPYPYPMDREAGIAAYKDLITADEHRRRIAKGDLSRIHKTEIPGDAPVLEVVVTKVEKLSDDVTKYEFQDPNGADLPTWTAGAHLDIVVAPEFLRQYSMSGNPLDRKTYQIGVLREDAGRGGSALMHRIFSLGRRVYLSKPINHFELVEDADVSFLLGGGIGITPMIAFAHRLHALGKPFELHYSAPTRARAAYLNDLMAQSWSGHVHLHISDEGTRANFDTILAGSGQNDHVYTCGADAYMSAVMSAAERAGVPEAARHLEYFNVPELPDYVNHPFVLKLRDGRELTVAADQSATDVLTENGIAIDVKCSDGICGVCKCGLVSGDVEHRDFVLSNSQRENSVILCQSRAAKPGGVIEVDL